MGNRDQAVAVETRVGEAARTPAPQPDWLICFLDVNRLSWLFLAGSRRAHHAYHTNNGPEMEGWTETWLTMPPNTGLWRGELAPGATRITWRALRPAEALRLFYPQLDLGTDDAVRLLRHAARLVEESREDAVEAIIHKNAPIGPTLAEDATHKDALATSLQRLVALFAPDVRP